MKTRTELIKFLLVSLSIYLSSACAEFGVVKKDDSKASAEPPPISDPQDDDDDRKQDAVDPDTVFEKPKPIDDKPDDEEEPPKDRCKVLNMDFDQDAAGATIVPGQLIDREYIAWGVCIEASSFGFFGSNSAVAFDSRELFNDPSGDLGQVLAIAQSDKDRDRDGVVDDLKMCTDEGKIIFNFDQPTELLSIDAINVSKKGSRLIVYHENGQVTEKDLEGSQGDYIQQITWPAGTKATKVKVMLKGSGAIDNFKICETQDLPHQNLDDM